MGLFTPWNWPSEAFTLPLAILILVLSWVALICIFAPILDFLSPLGSLKHARESAERSLKWPSDWLARHREDSAEHLDRVLMFMRKHIDPTMTPEQAAALTPEDIRSLDWTDSAWRVEIYAGDVAHMQDAFKSEQDAQKMYNETLAEYESLQKANFWSHRWRNFMAKDWRGGIKRGIKAAFKAIAWLTVTLYFLAFLSAGYYSWTHNVREAVGQDHTVVSTNFWSDSVTIEQDDCHITFPVDPDSSTLYTFTGDGEADLDMVIIRDGELVQPCLERDSN